MKHLRISTIALALTVGGFSSAQALTLVSASFPAAPASTTAFNAIGTFNFGNQKARLSAAGHADLLGGNPGNGWWGPNDGSGGLQRSWEVIWNNTTGSVTFNIYASNDHTGPAAMSMTQTPVLTPGFTLIGLDIGARLSATNQAFTFSNVTFDNGSGFGPVAVPGANASYSGDANFNNYFTLSGTLSSFVLRGQAQFTSGTTTGDAMRFFINGRQAVPEPASMTALGLGIAALLRRKRAATKG